MTGAKEFYHIIQKAYRRDTEGLRQLNTRWNGGDSEAFIKDHFIFVTSSHARGYCFHIYLIKEDYNDLSDKQIRSNAFEVYGIINGQPGWTEQYGWLCKGNWISPILEYLDELDRGNKRYDEECKAAKEKREMEENEKTQKMIDELNSIFT